MKETYLHLAEGTVGLRWFGVSNPWLDFVVFIRKENEAVAEKAILEGMDEFWDSNDLCYGDCVEWHLTKNGIVSFIFESLEEDEWGNTNDDEWEAFLQEFPKHGIPIRTIYPWRD